MVAAYLSAAIRRHIERDVVDVDLDRASLFRLRIHVDTAHDDLFTADRILEPDSVVDSRTVVRQIRVEYLIERRTRRDEQAVLRLHDILDLQREVQCCRRAECVVVSKPVAPVLCRPHEQELPATQVYDLRVELRLRDEQVEFLPNLSRRDVAVVHRRRKRLEPAARDEHDIVANGQCRLPPHCIRLRRNAVDGPRSYLCIARELVDHAVVLENHEVGCERCDCDDIATVSVANIHPLALREVIVVLRPVRTVARC